MSEMKSLTINGKKYDGFVDLVARALATEFAAINSASGESITVSDSSNSNLHGLRIYGKTTQDGTPTPDAPVELVNVGAGGSITVSVTGESKSQSMIISTPNGLPGIPVDSDGNYTDADGQQWICDEIDFARGVRVQKIGVIEYNNNSTAAPVSGETNIAGKVRWLLARDGERAAANDVPSSLLCNVTSSGSADDTYVCKNSVANGISGSVYLYLDEISSMTQEQALAWLKERQVKVLYILANPIETPLSEEELAAYKALYTYREHTTVSNDGHAYMELEYVMDAKKYIDSLVGGGSSARLANVALLASKWTGADSLYSQVVTINGITPYSKVDLLPSVEQLAIFHNKDVAFVTENEDGVVTVYAIGDKPTQDYTMQVSITEVTV